MNNMRKRAHDPVETLQKEIQTWDAPFVEIDCFGTESAERIAELINEFCRAYLGSGLGGYLFYAASVGSTHGVQLEDGREVAIKVRPPPETNPYLSHDRITLESVCRVMNWLADTGYPCPKPVLGPTPLSRGYATVEEFLEVGQRGDGFAPECRRAIASGLAHLIERLRSFDGEVSCLKHFRRSESLYAQPHSKLFDFEKTAKGAEWIDAFAERARQAEAHGDKPVLGHADWRVEHLRFQAGRIVAVYDWDSLAFRPETELVGMSAGAFTADWTLQGVRRIPTADDIRAYVADYEKARGQSFSTRERRSLFANCVYCIAYGARCAHSLEPDKLKWEENTWPHLLRTEGEALLGEATGAN
jgi:Phosphotransferase enzyme family